MNYSCWIEIDRSNLEHNILQYKSWIPKHTTIAPVIKGNAYGHGLQQIGYLHDQNTTVSRLCVSNSQEALDLRSYHIQKPILILSNALPCHYAQLALQNIDITLHDLQTAYELNTVAQKYHKKINVHIKIDTGMSRLGVYPHQFQTFLQELQTLNHLQICGIWSHLSSSNKSHIVHKQETLFKPFCSTLLQMHLANSLGALHCKQEYDFIRLGLGQYGYILSKNDAHKNMLKPVLSLKTRVILTKWIEKDSFIGYQQATKIKKRIKIAVLSIGYFEGLSPDLAHIGYVLIHGKFATILSINMNLTTVEITHIPECQMHDTVTILGCDQEKKITAYDWQILLNRNVRMFFAALNPALPRIIIQKQQPPLVLSMEKSLTL